MASQQNFIERDVAVVVGASKGIGEVTAIELAKTNKYNLLILARSKLELEQVAKLCEKEGNITVNIKVVDIGEEDSFETALNEGITELLPSWNNSKDKGVKNQFFVRVVVFCAGILNYSHSSSSVFAKLDWKKTINVNLLAAMTSSRICLPFMLKVISYFY